MFFKTWMENTTANEIILQDSKIGKLRLVKVADGLVTPTAFANDGIHMYVADQTGQIYILDEGGLNEKPFLDISNTIKKLSPNKEGMPTGLNPNYDERGLLGLVFHPNYKTNGRFFIYHSQKMDDDNFNHESVIAEYRVSKNSSQALKGSRKIILTIPQEKYTHNGGNLKFGPDGFLYISVGDGGCCGDPFGEIGNAQNLGSLKGKILRIDVNKGNPYAIPKDNPFVNKLGARPEIYAYGLRNPWSMSFDYGYSNKLYVGQVGEGPLEKGSGWECVFIVKKGSNCGWRIREGTHYFDKELMKKLSLKPTDFENPIYEYNHKIGISIIGGYVYRGKAIPKLFGKYIFGDWSQKWSERTEGSLFYLDRNNKAYTFTYPDNNKTLENLLLGFGEGPDRELYVLAKSGVNLKKKEGKVFKITPYYFS